MPKKKKSNNADQKIARKRADELVIRGNEQLQEVVAGVLAVEEWKYGYSRLCFLRYCSCYSGT